MDQSPQLVRGAQVWLGADLEARSDWIYELPATALERLGKAVADAGAKGLDQDTFDFEAIDIAELRAGLAPAKDALSQGYGLALVRGMDVSKFKVEELKLALLVIGHHLGLVGPQEHRAKGIAEVMDVNPQDGGRFYYHVGGPLPMHMDPVDIVGLLCVRKAKKGGESLIASSMAIHNEMLRTRPDLLDILYRGYRHRRREHRRQGGSALTEHYCPVFADIGGEVICNYLPAPIQMAVEDGLMTLSGPEREAMDVLESIAGSKPYCMTMDIEPGDIQFLNNRVTLHGRTDYEDFGEPDQRRLLLRTWLTMPGWRKFPANVPHTDVELATEPA